MPEPDPEIQLSTPTARAMMIAAQGLGGNCSRELAPNLEQTGFLRTLGDARHSTLRPIVAGGRLVGFWEFDPDAEEVVTGCFDEISSGSHERIAEEAAKLGRFLTEEVGHGRSFSLDTEESLRKRVAEIQRLGR